MGYKRERMRGSKEIWEHFKACPPQGEGVRHGIKFVIKIELQKNL